MLVRRDAFRGPDSISSLRVEYIVTWRRDESRMPALVGLLPISICQDIVKTWTFFTLILNLLSVTHLFKETKRPNDFSDTWHQGPYFTKKYRGLHTRLYQVCDRHFFPNLGLFSTAQVHDTMSWE